MTNQTTTQFNVQLFRGSAFVADLVIDAESSAQAARKAKAGRGRGLRAFVNGSTKAA